eukprot:TRINITY_DN6515_c0_g1_i2.p1 TRINITY_DN6515_c0_g1~~TRINITY_DN6515_c0_g1_i2.p1  ORF type:complete len:260 (-),score=50.71 TRINITY_DN6515_c0_g1_i2:87-866(-)
MLRSLVGSEMCIRDRVKLAQAQNSTGLSPSMLGMMAMYNVCTVCNLLFLKWPTVERCEHSAQCLVDLLDVFQTVASAGWNTSLMVQATMYPPFQHPPVRVAAASVCALLVSMIAATCMVSARSTCSEVSLNLAQGLTYTGSVLVMVAFAPQLWSTWKLKSAGSLSLFFILIQTVGNVLVFVNYKFIQDDPWTSWAPTLVAASMQGTIVSLGTYFYWTRERNREVLESPVKDRSDAHHPHPPPSPHIEGLDQDPLLVVNS